MLIDIIDKDCKDIHNMGVICPQKLNLAQMDGAR